jgi:hypothetical protein
MFEFFDKDKSGTVDRQEIMLAFQSTSENNVKKNEETTGNSTILFENEKAGLQESKVDKWISSAHIEGHHEEHIDKLELDFMEFVALFKSTFLEGFTEE